MNFIKLVNEVLLLEDPDHALFNGETLRYNDSSARTFFVADIRFKNPKSSELALFYTLEPGATHQDLYWAIWTDGIGLKVNPDREDWNPQWESYPSSIKDQIKKSVEGWNPGGEEPYEIKGSGRYAHLDLPSGRYWIQGKKFLISMWKGSDEDVKKWLTPILPIWNPNNYPILYQPVGVEYGKWVDGDSFLKSSSEPKSSKQSPETRQLQRQINKLLPQVHTSTGPEKQKIKAQIRTLQNRIKSLTGETPSLEDDISSKGSYKLGQIAGKMPIAQMKSLSQTSESLR
jgi:hypothetical protein